MADTQIHPVGVVSTPGDYVIPDSAELLLKSAFASFDGSGAAGSYVPLLRIISDAGSVVVEAVADTTIAAGASADASWFPHVGAGGTGSVITSTGLPVAALYSASGGVSIAADNAVHYVSLQDGVASAGFSTTNGSVFTNASTSLFTGSPVYGIGIQAAGTYAVFNNAFTMSGGVAGHLVTAYWAASDGSAPSFFQGGRSAANYAETWDMGQAGVGPHLFLHEWMTVAVGQTPAVLVPWAQVNGGTAASVAFQTMVVQLTPTVLSKL